ncbi:MAG: hypothetical protein AAFX50_18180, partial [Acidobacteriota bacterium]
VVWSGFPYSTASVVLETWVDGRKYFDRAEDLVARERVAAERQALIAAVRAAQASGDDGGEEAEKEDDEPGHSHAGAHHHHGPHREAQR